MEPVGCDAVSPQLELREGAYTFNILVPRINDFEIMTISPGNRKLFSQK